MYLFICSTFLMMLQRQQGEMSSVSDMHPVVASKKVACKTPSSVTYLHLGNLPRRVLMPAITGFLID